VNSTRSVQGNPPDLGHKMYIFIHFVKPNRRKAIKKLEMAGHHKGADSF
jgi:hypothetical protein